MVTADDDRGLPILDTRDYAAPSVFTAENLLREARRQKGIAAGTVPSVCVLDPDGDIVRHVKATATGRIDPAWACYHTEMIRTKRRTGDIGIVGCAVGAPFAVLVAEEMFASGARVVLSVTSAGQLVERRPPPYFILIDRALRDEGTSCHYAEPARFAHASPALLDRLQPAFAGLSEPVMRGGTWTTDAPFRETAALIEARRAEGLEAVEMEAAALYAFATATRRPVVCFAHITNRMAQAGDDFEKGEAGGAIAALALIDAVASALA